MSASVQNVNLYLPEFRKKKFWLDAEKMVLVAGASLLLLVVISGIEYWQLAQLRAELAQKEQEHQAAVLATADLRAQYGVQSEDPSLLANIQALEEDLKTKLALLQFLEGRELGNADGFSEHLADFARYHVRGVSLNKISLSKGGRSVQFGGQVVAADLVTVYMQNLNQSRTYAGMNFEMLQIQKQPAGSATSEANGADLAVWNFQTRSLQQDQKTTEQ